MSDVYLCGWRVSSQIPLRGLPSWNGDPRYPDVAIRHGEVSSAFIADPTQVTVQVESRARCRFYIPDVASIEIRDGREVIVQAASDASPEDLRTCLSGTTLGILCLLRNLLPLHASCVRMGTGAVCFTGHSGAGKSTLAATLARRGYPLLSDDVCAVDLSGSVPLVLPSLPSVRLGDRSAHAVGLPDSAGQHLGADRVKQQLRFTEAQTDPVPISAVYRLEKALPPSDFTNGLTSGLSSKDQLGAASLLLLHGQIFRNDVARQLGLSEALFTAAARLCSAIPVRILARPFDLSRLGETADLLESLHKEPTGAELIPFAEY